MSSSPRPQTPTTPSPWWSRICRVCWIVLRFFWVTIVIGLALNAIVSLAFFSRGTSLQSLYLWPVLDWMQSHQFLMGLIIPVLVGLTGLTWFCSRHGETAPREPTLAKAPIERDRTALIRLLAACRREGKPPFFLPPGPRGWHTKPSCAPPGGRNGADNQCSAPYFCSLRQTARK